MLSLGIGVNGRKNVSLYDASALAFINATGLTGTTEKTAVNNLVKNLKSYGLWSKMKAIYPFVSDTYNLLSYTEDFTNAAWQKANASITANTTTSPDGTTTADTITDNSTSALHQIQYPITTTVGAYTISCYAKAGTLSYVGLFNNSSNQGKFFNLSNGTTAGNIVAAPTSTTIQSVGNGWYRFSITTTTLGSNSNWQIIVSEDGINYSYSGTGKNAYIWGAQLDAGTTATAYQPIATTPANRFVSQFKYNLKDPRDLDAAFRLSFSGTWTYSKQGATPNGVNAFANTYVNPTTLGFTQTDTHISAYLRTDSNGAKVDIGGSYNLFMGVRWANNYNYPINRSNNANGTSANSIGYFLASRVDNVRDRMYKNGTNVTNFNGAAVSLDNNTIMISATNGGGLYSDRQTAFNTIGNGLTDTEISNLYSSIQTFQTALARQV